MALSITYANDIGEYWAPVVTRKEWERRLAREHLAGRQDVYRVLGTLWGCGSVEAKRRIELHLHAPEVVA